MTITELIPTVKGLSHTDKLLLLQVLVQALLQNEGVTEALSSSFSQTEQSITEASTFTLEERRHFLEKPLAERRRILAEQAEAIHDHYQQDSEWQDLMAGDIVDYESRSV
ncbi:hypothetical protein [Acaryochloris sp. IP29b_bin.148]|uniref:hypothetical protein n=1 Tax=Acaryochloris sp. IP29b_bin.148 TaxID=2969218 RepID=UPI00262A42B7|nr:hypothetical protein [Acaryochloris sp. IP29b_bin.148]